MKKILAVLLGLSLITACQKSDDPDAAPVKEEVEIENKTEESKIKDDKAEKLGEEEKEIQAEEEKEPYERDLAVLDEKLRSFLDEAGVETDRVGLMYQNLDTGEVYELNSNEIFLAGSTTKVPIVMHLFDLAYEGVVDLDQYLTVGEQHLEDGTGVIYYEDGPGSSYSLYELARLMIEASDNTATNMIYGYLGEVNGEYLLNTLAWRYGLSSYDGNYITPSEACSVLERIYLNEENNPYYDDLLNFMENTIYNDYFTPEVKAKEIAHKTGDYDGYFNDIGIVYAEDSTYLFAVYTNNLYDPIYVLNSLGGIVSDWHNGPGNN